MTSAPVLARFDDPAALLDAHVHYYDLVAPEGEGRSPERHWLDPSFVHWTLGDLTAIRGLRFGPDELFTQGRLSGVAGAIHVQASRFYADPVAETEWLARYGSSESVPLLAIMAHADLADPGRNEVLDRHAAAGPVRGIRDFAANGALADPAFREGLGELQRRGWAFEWDADWRLATEITDAARQLPELRLILEHCAFPPDPGPERVHWRAALRQLAANDNVALKLSGWSVTTYPWTTAEAVSMMNDCLEAFGTDRILFGSNWPFGLIASSYRDVTDAFETGVAGLTTSEQHALRSRNALRWYGVEA